MAAPDGDLLTLTPRTDDLRIDEDPPWVEAGALLARLHRSPVPDGLPEHGGRAYLQVAVDAATVLHPGGATDILRELGGTLVETWPEPTTTTVVHGDWDLGNLGRLPGTSAWVLTGPETLGVGDPRGISAGPPACGPPGSSTTRAGRRFFAGTPPPAVRCPRRGSRGPRSTIRPAAPCIRRPFGRSAGPRRSRPTWPRRCSRPASA